MAQPGDEITWQKIEAEIDGRDAWRQSMSGFDEETPRALAAPEVRAAQVRLRSGGNSHSGRGLINRLAAANRDRFETLLYFERQWGERDDYGFLIGPACWILESEIDRRLATPALAIVDELAAALAQAGDEGPAKILEKWGRTRITTMGAERLLMLALRRGMQQDRPAVRALLEAQFQPAFAQRVLDNSVGRCLDVICDRYRNKVCHGQTGFDSQGYDDFTQLMVANRRFVDWDRSGPESNPPATGSGILHLNLSLAADAADDMAGHAEQSAVDRLLALTTPIASSLWVAIQVVPSHTPASRDITISAPGRSRVFRLGDCLRVEFTANSDGHLTLVDVGTSGAVSVIWPNAWRRDTAVAAGQRYSLPSVDGPEFEYRLSGKLGPERIQAILTRDTLPGALVLPEADHAMRQLEPTEVQRIVDLLAGMDPSDWAVATCEFQIER